MVRSFLARRLRSAATRARWSGGARKAIWPYPVVAGLCNHRDYGLKLDCRIAGGAIGNYTKFTKGSGFVRIAILEDDTSLSRLYQNWLEEDGHTCQCYENGKSFLKALSRESFDLAILDWELPDMTGADVLQKIRQQLDWPMPVIFATNRNDEADIVFALKSGADDYMIKPVKQQELLARLIALGRRSGMLSPDNSEINTAPYKLDPADLTASFDAGSVVLTRKEYDLAVFLFKNHGRLLSRKHIMENVWGQSEDLNTRTVDTHVSAIRQKLQIGPERGWRLSSIYGHGYRLEKVNK